MGRQIYLTLVLILLTACTAEPSATPATALSPVATSPAFVTLVTRWIAEYPSSSEVLIEVHVLPPQEVRNTVMAGDSELALAGGTPPDGWFATPLFEEGIAVIVHPGNRVRSYTLEDLAAVFSGQVRNWSDLGGANQAIQPIIPIATDEIRVQFESIVLGELSPAVNTLLAPTPSAMNRMIAEDPGAVGYIPLSILSEQVRAVRVEKFLPSIKSVQDGDYPLSITVLAFAPKEPIGALRDWLVWIQDKQSSGR